MGGEPWSSFAKYKPNLQQALDAHRQEVFALGAYRYAEEDPSSIEEALEISDADGTASILDIQAISDEPDFCSAAPFTDEELVDYFGSTRPTRADIEAAADCFEEIERGHARYAIVYEGDEPVEIFFAGVSFD